MLDFSTRNFDANFYIPFFDILGTSIELLFGMGQANVKLIDHTENVAKFHAGLQTRIFGIIGLNLVYEKYGFN